MALGAWVPLDFHDTSFHTFVPEKFPRFPFGNTRKFVEDTHLGTSFFAVFWLLFENVSEYL